jgi:VanZ family protein
MLNNRTKAIGIAIFVMFIVFAALGPARLQCRTGLGWQFDHVLGYFALTSMICLAYPRPILIGGAVIALATLLEGLQALTPDRTADLQAVLWSSSGVLAAALLCELFIRAMRHLSERAFSISPVQIGSRLSFISKALMSR